MIAMILHTSKSFETEYLNTKTRAFSRHMPTLFTCYPKPSPPPARLPSCPCPPPIFPPLPPACPPPSSPPPACLLSLAQWPLFSPCPPAPFRSTGCLIRLSWRRGSDHTDISPSVLRGHVHRDDDLRGRTEAARPPTPGSHHLVGAGLDITFQDGQGAPRHTPA